MKPRLTYEFVKAQFEKEGYQLLSTEYKNIVSKLDYICPNGHQHSITLGNFQKGSRCAYCTKGVVCFDRVKTYFQKEGYQLLSNNCKNARQKLRYACPKGHRHTMSWHNFYTGHRCFYCKKKVVTHEQVVKEFKSNGYQLLSKEYKNATKKLDFVCPKGHSHSMTWNAFQSGSRCGQCVNNGGYNKKKAGRLYYLRFDFPGSPPFYKIGITNLSVKHRIGKHDMKYCTVIMDKYHKDGSIPLIEERKILTRFSKFRYKGKPLLKYSGNTELFTRDVLMLDRERLSIA